jgi:Ca2+-binding RTX toxin-like protein
VNGSPRNPILAAGVIAASVAALALPAAASATVTVDASGDPIAFQGDGADDNLVLSVGGGKIAHNLPAAQGFASPTDLDPVTAGTQDADVAGANIVVRGGAGNDNLNASALGNTYNSLEIQGEAGDDVVTGGGKADTLGGGDGDDRVVGAQGGDVMSGGAGNDVLVWNNGDGSDTMDGDTGNDEIEVNGSATAGDEFTIAAGSNGRTKFDRVNLVPFTLDTLAERMTVSGLGGNDKTTGAPGLAGRILLTLNGNAGADTLTGGDGADRIGGGEAADVLDGGAGDDNISGDRGADHMGGGAGDDVLEWNNGDGSDVATGGDGADLVRVNGSVTDGDAMEVAPAGAGIRFQRTNLVPFTIDLDTERIEMNGLGGNDTIAAKRGLAGRLGVVAAGGSGNDRIEVRNGAADSAQGGSGSDSAVVDRADTVSDVESVDRPPRSVASIRGKARIVHGGHRPLAVFKVSSPAGAESNSTGVLRLSTAKAIRVAGVKLRVDLGSRRFDVAPGETDRVRVKLPAKARSLAKRGKLRVHAVASSEDGGSLTESARNLTLKFSRAR